MPPLWGDARSSRAASIVSDCVSALSAMASEYARIALNRRQRSESGAGPSAETRQLMGDARSRRAAEIRAWEAAHPVIPASHIFADKVLSRLKGLRAPDVRDATGLSIWYCRRVLRGQYIPHAMHWDTIKGLSRDARIGWAVRPGALLDNAQRCSWRKNATIHSSDDHLAPSVTSDDTEDKLDRIAEARSQPLGDLPAVQTRRQAAASRSWSEVFSSGARRGDEFFLLTARHVVVD